MNKKTVSGILITLILAITASNTTFVISSPTTTVYVDPSNIIDPSLTPGSTFTIDINIADVEDLYSWGIKVQWDPNLLEVIDVTEGPFLKGQPDGTAFVYVIEDDYVDVGCSTLGDWFGVWGNGTLMTVTFNVTDTGETDLGIYYAVLLNYDMAQIPHTTVDGYFSNTEPAGTVTISVDPPMLFAGSGEHFTVNLTITNAVDVYGWQVNLTFDPTIVQCVDATLPPDHFLAGAPEGVVGLFKLTTSNSVVVGTCILGDYLGMQGSGVLVTIEFEVVGIGESVLGIDDTPGPDAWTFVVNSDTEYTVPPDLKTEDGYFSSVAVQYQLTVDSDPISGVDFTVDSTSHSTSWSGNLSAGSHTIVMSSVWMNGSDSYAFDHWEDASTSPMRVVSLTANKTVIAYYVPATLYELTVDSDPSDGVEFTLDGIAYTTTWTDSVVEGNHTVVMPFLWRFDSVIHVFVGWDDGPTDRTRVITVPDDGDYFSAVYEELTLYELTVDSDPIDGVEFTLDGVTHTTTWAGVLVEGNHTIVMPAIWMNGSDLYAFDHWEDASTDPTRIVSLTADRIVTAYYVLRPCIHVLFDQTHGTDNLALYSRWIADLTDRDYTVDAHTAGPITSSVLVDYDIFVIPQAHNSYSTAELSATQDFVSAGGGLLVIGDDYPYIYTDLTSFAGITWLGEGYGGYTSDITPHPVTDGVTTAYFGSPVSCLSVESPAQDLIRDSYGYVMLAVSEIGRGKVLGIADENSIADGQIGYADNFRLASNVIDWFTIQYEHELAVTLEAPTFLEPGNSVLLNTTVYNRGLSNETNVELHLLINGTSMNSTVFPSLDISEIARITYLWTPTVEGTYNVTAYAPPISDESFTWNNRVTRLVTVTHTLIKPVEGQWANYTITSVYKETGEAMVMLLNSTYRKYIHPYLMNVTISMEYPYGGTMTSWLTLNVMTRKVEAGIWVGMSYPLWIETNVTLGSEVKILDTVGTVTGSRFVEIGELLIDSWELQVDYYPTGYTFLFDKATGLLTGAEGESPYYTDTWRLIATNILKLLRLEASPEHGPVGTDVMVTSGDATPGGSVEIYWDDTLLGTAIADALGNFSFTLTVPPSNMSSHQIKALDLPTHTLGIATFIVVPSVSIAPISGPVGTRVVVTGYGHGSQQSVILSFDDMQVAGVFADDHGSFTATFNVPLSEAGIHRVKAWYDSNYVEATFTVIDVSPLDVQVDVGSLYFKGETAEFFLQTSFKGVPVDVTSMHITLHKPDGTAETLTAQRIATGLYKIEYLINGKGSMLGTYTLVVEASYHSETVNAVGTSLKTFIVKSPWKEWEKEAPKIIASSIASIGLVSALIILRRKEKRKSV